MENCKYWKSISYQNFDQTATTLALLWLSSQFLWRWKTFSFLITSYAFEQSNVRDKREWTAFYYDRLIGLRLLQTASLSVPAHRLLPKMQVLSLLKHFSLNSSEDRPRHCLWLCCGPSFQCFKQDNDSVYILKTQNPRRKKSMKNCTLAISVFTLLISGVSCLSKLVQMFRCAAVLPSCPLFLLSDY